MQDKTYKGNGSWRKQACRTIKRGLWICCSTSKYFTHHRDISRIFRQQPVYLFLLELFSCLQLSGLWLMLIDHVFIKHVDDNARWSSHPDKVVCVSRQSNLQDQVIFQNIYIVNWDVLFPNNCSSSLQDHLSTVCLADETAYCKDYLYCNLHFLSALFYPCIHFIGNKKCS